VLHVDVPDVARFRVICRMLAAAMTAALPKPRGARKLLTVSELALVAATWDRWASHFSSTGDHEVAGARGSGVSESSPLKHALMEVRGWLLPLNSPGLLAAIDTQVQAGALARRLSALRYQRPNPRGSVGGAGADGRKACAPIQTVHDSKVHDSKVHDSKVHDSKVHDNKVHDSKEGMLEHYPLMVGQEAGHDDPQATASTPGAAATATTFVVW
jgi:hypothetical protein